MLAIPRKTSKMELVIRGREELEQAAVTYGFDMSGYIAF